MAENLYISRVSLMVTLFFIIIGISQKTAAQDSLRQDSIPKRVRIAVLPVVYSTPETGLALGAGASFAGKLDPLSETSSLQIGGVYTFREQLLLYLPFRLFFGADKYRAKGEFGFYDFIYEYYGIGDNPGEQTFYTAIFPKIELGLYQQIRKDLFVGLFWRFNDYRFRDLDENDGTFSPTTLGIDGGRISTLGPTFQLDKRDGQYWTKKGYYLEGGISIARNFLASNYDYARYYLDYRKFFSLGADRVLGYQVYHQGVWGNAPFFDLPIIGGSKLLRSYYQGYLRDDFLLLGQFEFRDHLVWKFSYAVFAGLGTISPAIDQFLSRTYWPSVGAGIRFPIVKDEGINLRLDYAFGRGTSGLYLTFGEAF